MIDTILERLQKVKLTKPGQWVACCPAHADKNPSLALKLCDNGKILIKCWSGCGVQDIVDAIGLELQDLFPDKGEYKREQKEYFSAETILRALHKESCVIRLMATQLKQGIPLSDSDLKRIRIAENRIHDACSYVEK